MGLLQRPSCCSNSKHQQQPHSQDHHHLHSESSSLSSQPSLPSVPSLTPPQNHHQPPQTTTHHRLVATVKAHTSPISALTLHAKSLFSASSDGQVKTCSRDPSTLQTSDTNNNNNVVVASTTAPIKSLIVHNDVLITAHQDHKIRVWKSDNQSQINYKCIATLPTLHDRISKLFSSKNYVKIRRHKKRTWVHHVDAVSALALSQDNSLLYSASWDRTFKIWRTSDFKCLESVQNAHDDAINALILSQNGVVYTGSADTKIKMWKKKKQEEEEEEEGEKTKSTQKHFLLGTLEKHRSAVNALALSGDGSVLYSGACDRSILVWERDGGSEGMVVVGALRGHTKAILCLVVVGDLVCSGSADKSVRVWRRGVEEKGYSCLAVLEAHRRPVKCLAMAVDSSNMGGGPHQDHANTTSYLVYTAGLDCDINVWQIRVPS